MTYSEKDVGLTSNINVLDQLLTVEGHFLVDAGCGDMGLSRALAKRGASVLAIDPDPVQAALNNQADIINNVGFAQTGADAIPVEEQSVDGVLFSYSLHHVPEALYEAVFKELRRVLKPDGFVYVIEPVAAGDLNEVMRLFHDEAVVRASAQKALDTLAIPNFSDTSVVNYRITQQFGSWDDYQAKYVGKSYNTSSYTIGDVQNDAVKARFLELGTPTDFKFECPVKVTYLRNPKALHV